MYSMDQRAEWDDIVQSFTDHDVYYFSGYVKAFQLHGDGEPLLFYYNGNGIRGINVVMKRDIEKDKNFSGKIPNNTYYDFATPYGYGGWLTEGSGNVKALMDEYTAWCARNGIICEFVRFHPLLKNHINMAGAYEIVPLGEVVHMDLTEPDMIWSNLTSKNRNVIRKAVKNGVTIKKNCSVEMLEVFRGLYNKTMDKDNAADYYYFNRDFYQSIAEDFSDHTQVFYAQIPDDTIIAAAIIIFANDKMYYHLSGSMKEYSSLAATNLLLYEAAVWGSKNGYRTFYLGGGVGSGEDSLFKFKRAFFRGELNRFHIGKRIYMQDQYDKLLAIRAGEIRQNDFFPKYRG